MTPEDLAIICTKQCGQIEIRALEEGAISALSPTCKVSTKLPITHSIFHAIFSETTSTRLPKRIKFAKKYNFREINFTKFHRNFFFFFEIGTFRPDNTWKMEENVEVVNHNNQHRM